MYDDTFVNSSFSRNDMGSSLVMEVRAADRFFYTPVVGKTFWCIGSLFAARFVSLTDSTTAV